MHREMEVISEGPQEVTFIRKKARSYEHNQLGVTFFESGALDLATNNLGSPRNARRGFLPTGLILASLCRKRIPGRRTAPRAALQKTGVFDTGLH